jgi:hypothetical protein
MSPKLKDSPQIWKLAHDLGIRGLEDPIGGIIRFCERKVKKMIKDFPDCSTLADLLDFVAGKIGTVFELVQTDDDLVEIKGKYLKRGEKAFVQLDEDLPEEVFGITFKRTHREDWEPEFVSVIDCRGSKAARSYYTKWHEIAHLLILTDQRRLSFRRTYHLAVQKDPEEAVIDLIAGTFGFYAPFVQEHAAGELSFEVIEHLRRQLCPEASQQSSLIGLVKAWPDPCLLVHCEIGVRKRERGREVQGSFHFRDVPTPTLRAVKVTANEKARESGISIFENMRIPEGSVIHRVFMNGIDYDEAEEDLCWWETSDGTVLRPCRVRVKAKQSWDSVDALIMRIT